MAATDYDVVVLYENEEWQQPLFDVLDKRNISYGRYDLKSGAFNPADIPTAKVYFNQASPSAYVRGRPRVVPFTLALLKSLEIGGARVINGADVFAFELSKSTQAAQMKALGIDHPSTVVFNDVDALDKRADIKWPAMLKPEQGGSGARMHKLESLQDLKELLIKKPDIWNPDNLLLLQEYCEHDPEFGIVRLEFVGGKLLYGMRVVTHGRFNLCPSEACNPVDGKPGVCGGGLTEQKEEDFYTLPQPEQEAKFSIFDMPKKQEEKQAHEAVEFYALPLDQIPEQALRDAERIVRTARMDVAGIEYMEMPDGRRVFYDINANSNLRKPVAMEFGGFDPFERVADYLESEVERVSP